MIETKLADAPPRPGPHELTAAGATDLMSRLRPTDAQALRRTFGWIVMVLLLDVVLTATGLIPTLSSTCVFLFLPPEAQDAPLTFWAPGRMTAPELVVAAVLVAVLAMGGALLHGSDRALWQTPLSARETRPRWVLALRVALGVYAANVLLQIVAFRSPLSYPVAGRVLMAGAAGVVLAHLVVRVRSLTLTHPRLHGSLVGAVLAAVAIQALSALGAQLYDLTGPYPTAMGELKVLQLACGLLAGGYLAAYVYFAALTPAPNAAPAGPADASAADPAGEPEPAGTTEDWRDAAYVVTLVPDGKPTDTVAPPAGGGIPPVRGGVAYEAKDHLFAFREQRGWYVLCQWNWLELSRFPHLLIDTDALRERHRGELEFGGSEEWLSGQVRWHLTLPAESVPERMPVKAWQVFRQILANPDLTDKLSAALDARFGRFLGLFEANDRTPLGRNPKLIAVRMRQQFDERRGAAYLAAPGGTLLERCTALAALRQERKSIRRILQAIDGTESSVLQMAAGAGSAFVASSLLGAMPASTAMDALAPEQRLAIRDFLGRFLLDVTVGAGSRRPGLTPRALEVLAEAREPLTANLDELKVAYRDQVGLFRKQLGAQRNDAKAVRDCRLRIEELVVTGVFDKDNVAPVLAHLTPEESRDVLLRHSMFFGQAAAPDRDRDLDELDDPTRGY